MGEVTETKPIRLLTNEMMAWASYLDVLQTMRAPLPGASERRVFDVDPRLNVKPMVMGGQNLGPKNSDVITYYEHVATLRHKEIRPLFVVFQETMDALLARQKDVNKYPRWLMHHDVKKTELQYFIGMADPRRKPTATTTSLDDWLVPLEEVFPETDVNWIYDTLGWYLLKKGVIQERFYGRA
jgi:hypothetical protein